MLRAIEDLRDNPPTADSVSNVTSTSSSFTIHLSSGTTFGPFTLPTAEFAWQDEWTSATSYQTNDIVKVSGDGVYLVLQDHTSAGTFDSAAADSDGAIYKHMIGAGADGADGADGTNGTDGTDGATWYTGIGAPSISDAVQGDLYLDTGDSDGTGEGDVYEHQGSDSWTLIASLKGETGATGAQGPTGAGSNIIVEEGTVALADPVSNLNFDGDDFNVTQDSDGTANVTLAGSGATAPTRTVQALSGSSDIDVSIPADCTHFVVYTDTAWAGYMALVYDDGGTLTVNTQSGQGGSGLDAFVTTAGATATMYGKVWSPRDATKRTMAEGHSSGGSTRRTRCDLVKDDSILRFAVASGSMSGNAEIEWFYN